MSKKERVAPAPVENGSKHNAEPRRLTIAEARRKAFEASDKAQAAQVAYSEAEAQRWSDYRVEE